MRSPHSASLARGCRPQLATARPPGVDFTRADPMGHRPRYVQTRSEADFAVHELVPCSASSVQRTSAVARHVLGESAMSMPYSKVGEVRLQFVGRFPSATPTSTRRSDGRTSSMAVTCVRASIPAPTRPSVSTSDLARTRGGAPDAAAVRNAVSTPPSSTASHRPGGGIREHHHRIQHGHAPLGIPREDREQLETGGVEARDGRGHRQNRVRSAAERTVTRVGCSARPAACSA